MDKQPTATRVLLIEDNPGDARLLREMLDGVGHSPFNLECTDRLSKGLELLTAGGFDVILLDLSLPDAQGLDAVIKVHSQAPEVPIVVLTSLDDERLASKAVRKGAQDYLVKGQVDSNLLLRSLRYAVKCKQAQQELIESEKKYRSLVDNIGVGISLISPRMEILSLNKQMKKWFPEVDVSKKSICYKVFNKPPRKGICLDCPTDKTLKDGRVHESTVNTRRGNEVRHYRVISFPAKDKAGKITAAIEMVEDVTKQKRAEEKLRQSEQELSIRNRIANIFLTSPDKKIYEKVLQVILETAESKYGVLGYINQDGALVASAISKDVWDKCRMSDKKDVFPPEIWGGIWGRALKKKKSFYANKPSRVPKGHVPISRSLAVPIIHQGIVIALFHVANKATDYDENDRELLETIAAEIAPILAASLQRDIQEEERKWVEEKLRKSEARKGAILVSAFDCIVTIDHTGKIIEFNPAAEKTFGYKRSQAMGKDMAELIIPPALREKHRRGMEHYLATGKSAVLGHPVEISAMRSDGSEFPVELTITTIVMLKGPQMFTAYLRDITERKRMEAELEESRQEQLKMKDHFLSHVSHELRSPLTAIHQFVTIILDGLVGNIGAKQREYMGIVLRNTNQLRTMIGDLLEVTRTESGTLVIEPEHTPLAELIAETISSHQPAAADKDITLSARVSKTLPAIYADPSRVQEILTNLVDNALKFTPEKGTITVRARRYKSDSGFICVSVADNGCGISPQGAKMIFERMFQDKATCEGNKASRKGLGLGLYICKELVDRQGGEIWLKSKLGKGSTFFFTLPIDK